MIVIIGCKQADDATIEALMFENIYDVHTNDITPSRPRVASGIGLLYGLRASDKILNEFLFR